MKREVWPDVYSEKKHRLWREQRDPFTLSYYFDKLQKSPSNNGFRQKHSNNSLFEIIIAHYIKIAGLDLFSRNRSSFISSKSVQRAGKPFPIPGGG